MKLKLKKLLNKLLGRISTKLPVGMTEFNSWAASIVETYDFPDNDSVRFALATMILHADQAMAYAPKHYFALRLSKSMANQVAGQVFQDIKTKQQEAIKSELAAPVSSEQEKTTPSGQS